MEVKKPQLPRDGSMKGTRGQRPQEPSISKAALEAGAERVFVSHPRMFSFSHRNLQSLRHPYLPAAVAQVEAELARVKRNWQSRGERLSDLLTEGTSHIRIEETRWRLIGQMLDGVLGEQDISDRRQLVIENPTLRRSLENWWCKVGGSTGKGVEEAAYKRVHQGLYTAVLQLQDTSLQGVINKAIDADWVVDSEGSGEVPFGRFYLSLLEIADNWIARCDGEAYGNYLDALLSDVTSSTQLTSPTQKKSTKDRSGFGSPERIQLPVGSGSLAGKAVPYPSGSILLDVAPEEWESVTESLYNLALRTKRRPLVRQVRNIRGQIHYEKVQPM
jgi:hypothetical protein